MRNVRLTEELLVDLEERPWASYAACRGADPNLFFPGDDQDAAIAVLIANRIGNEGTQCWSDDKRSEG